MAQHTCPMHPKVLQEGPGSCPDCGMALEPLDPLAEQDDGELKDMGRRLRWAAAFSLPLLLVSMGDMLPGAPISGLLSRRLRVLLELALASPVVLFAAQPFFERALASVRNRSPNMFTLIGLGVSVAYGYSLVAALAPQLFPPAFRGADGQVAVYFEASAVIVTLVLVGQVLELRARGRTGAAIRALLELAPENALRIEQDGDAVVHLCRVRSGDRLRVRPGERVPVDGVVLEGESYVDESMLTGEPMPEAKSAGEPLIGGTLNQQGALVMRAEQVGDDTLLKRIVARVAQAQRSRAPVQQLADRVAVYFVPAVVLSAVLTFVLWALLGPEPPLAYALVNSVAVLIIACPCALGLATPMSITVAMGKGASHGVLFREARAIEALRDVDTLVVDKTGTLTEGRPEVVCLEPSAGVEEAELLASAAALERHSEHPLGAAILRAAGARGAQPVAASDFQAVPGRGVRGRLGERRAWLGSAAFMGEQGLELGAAASRAEALRGQGRTVVFVAIDEQLLGLIAVADPIKATSAAAMVALRAEGLELVMLTGDDEATARAVASELGIEQVIANALPQQKADTIESLRARGRRVAMAGDGMNDAAALAAADVGIAMGTGSDVALQSAAVTLVRGDLGAIVRARRLSRATMANIRQNLFFAFAYNSLGVPLAAGALYPVFGLLLSPMFAAAAMSLSSVSVIGNALRLRRLTL